MDNTANTALRQKIERTIATKPFCTIATTSPAGRSHVAGVVYDAVDSTLWVHTTSDSRSRLKPRSWPPLNTGASSYRIDEAA